jgi:hypothetical protein
MMSLINHAYFLTEEESEQFDRICKKTFKNMNQKKMIAQYIMREFIKKQFTKD